MWSTFCYLRFSNARRIPGILFLLYLSLKLLLIIEETLILATARFFLYTCIFSCHLRCRCWLRITLKLSFNVCGTWCPDLVINAGYTVGGELVARVCHIWCDLRILEHLAVRISEGVSADQETARNRTRRDTKRRRTYSQSGTLPLQSVGHSLIFVFFLER